MLGENFETEFVNMCWATVLESNHEKIVAHQSCKLRLQISLNNSWNDVGGYFQGQNDFPNFNLKLC